MRSRRRVGLLLRLCCVGFASFSSGRLPSHIDLGSLLAARAPLGALVRGSLVAIAAAAALIAFDPFPAASPIGPVLLGLAVALIAMHELLARSSASVSKSELPVIAP